MLLSGSSRSNLTTMGCRPASVDALMPASAAKQTATKPGFPKMRQFRTGVGRDRLGGGTAKAPGGERGQGRRHEHGRRGVHPCQQGQRGEAAGRGAEQVDAIGDADRQAAACQGERHCNATDRERRREQHNGLEPEHGVGRPMPGLAAETRAPWMKQAAMAQRESRRYPRQEGVDVPRLHVIELVVDDQGAAGEPQHGHADREECHVVERDNGQDAGLDDLNHQDGHAQQKDTCQECERIATCACHGDLILCRGRLHSPPTLKLRRAPCFALRATQGLSCVARSAKQDGRPGRIRTCDITVMSGSF